VTATAQQTYTVTYEQLVRLSVLGERARKAADELNDLEEKIGVVVYEIAGPFAADTDEEEKFFEPFLNRVAGES
jgi:hypothetical protein